MTCGIYMIRNKVDGKMYIGQATDIEGARWKIHRNELRGNRHYNEHLQRSWNKYGEDNFEFIILLECEENQLNTFEEYYIFESMAYDPRVGYNKTYGGDRGRPTEETKRKLRENNIWNDKGRCEEARKKLSEARKGINNPMYGKTGENNPMYGKIGENNPKSKPVVQIDLNTNEVINTYSCICEVTRQTGFDQGNISKCCNGKYLRPGNNIYKGYKWMYLEDYNKLKEEN